MTLAWSSETAALAEARNDRRTIGRWTGSLIAVALLHVVGGFLLLHWHAAVEPIEAPPAAIMIDLPPVPVPLPVPTPPPPPVFEPPKPPEPIREALPEPKVVPPKPAVVLPPKPKPVPRTVEDAPPPRSEQPPVAAAPRPPEPVTAPPAPAAPAASPTYDGLLVAQIQRNKNYPPAAQRTNIQGRPVVRFTLARNGSLLSVELLKSCGHSMLDDAAVATIKRAAPFPPFPPELTQPENTWNVPVNFELLRR